MHPEPLPKDYFSNCTHCGFCLAVCPTYKLSGDENNSPRGRLRIWSEEAAGRLPRDEWTDFYTAECVGCLACETACPAQVRAVAAAAAQGMGAGLREAQCWSQWMP